MYEWDEVKRTASLEKHGVDFAAMAGFDWETAIVIRDTRKHYGEARLRAAGLIDGRLHMAVFTWRNGNIRMISLRKANAREQRQWAKR